MTCCGIARVRAGRKRRFRHHGHAQSPAPLTLIGTEVGGLSPGTPSLTWHVVRNVAAHMQPVCVSQYCAPAKNRPAVSCTTNILLLHL